MRLLKCQFCRMGNLTWLVFDSVPLCDNCRLSVVEWMRNHGFSLASPHPFLDEFTGIVRPTCKPRQISYPQE